MNIVSAISLITWPIFLILSYILLRMTRLNVRIHSLSQLGSNKTTGWIFNTLLFYVSCIETIFLFRYTYLEDLMQRIMIYLFLCTSVCGMLVSYISERKSQFSHRIIVFIGFSTAIAGWCLLGIQLSARNTLLFLVMLTWALYFTLTCIRRINLKTYIMPAIYESLMFLGAFLTNVIIMRIYGQ